MTSAADIAHALGGKRSGDYFVCHCPVPSHGGGQGDRRPSLLIKDGETALLFTCFAGCDARDILAALRGRGIIDDRNDTRPAARFFKPPAAHEPDPEALKIWRFATPATGSIVETYLRGRGITVPVPPSLRCGERVHLGRYLMPAMVAAIQRPDGKIVATQSTLLTTAGKKASVSTPRITTGSLGLGAVRLAPVTDVLGIGEGVESALSAMQLTGVPCWACLGAARMQRVAIPQHVRELHVFADNDEPGRTAAERTAHENRQRRILLRFPPNGFKDWNDVLLKRERSAA